MVVLLGGLLAAVFLLTGVLKVLGAEVMRGRAAQVGMSVGTYRLVGWSEVAAAAGLVGGLVVPALAVAALVGLVLLMVGAVLVHVRSGDRAGAVPATVCGLAVAGLLALLVT